MLSASDDGHAFVIDAKDETVLFVDAYASEAGEVATEQFGFAERVIPVAADVFDERVDFLMSRLFS